MKCLLAAVALCCAGPVPAAALPLASSPGIQDPSPSPTPKPEEAQGSGIPECKDMKKTASGLEYGVLRKGGEEAAPGPDDMVEVHYTGWLTDGTKFDSSRDRGMPASFPVKGVIKGWTEGLQLMAPGAHFKLVIPGDLGYGANGSPPKIPGNATLVFEVELLKVTRMPKFRPADPKGQKELQCGGKCEVVKVGTGAQITEKDAVSLRYAVFSPEGQLFQCTEQNGHKIAGTLATLPFPFLKEVVASAKVGDVLRIEVPQEQLQNSRSATVWEIEILGAKPAPEVPKFRELDKTKIVTTQSGLVYEVIEPGTGASPKASDAVVAYYTGWLADGTMFDSAHERGAPSEFGLGQVIKGWTEGLQLMKVGGKFLFQIPGDLAYGPQGRLPKIPANATLVFLVELVDVKSNRR